MVLADNQIIGAVAVVVLHKLETVQIQEQVETELHQLFLARL